jgi:3'5'-cyclic nucleotide phosphodiesterase/Adenylate and Guanylate cyclase catalytic domain
LVALYFTDLRIRIGLHSGPVTAGILRGEKARFQLFGETVNFTAQMEHCGQPNKIHISQQTADLLVIAGKSSWIEPNHESEFEDIDTFWLSLRPGGNGAQRSLSISDSGGSSNGDSNRQDADLDILPDSSNDAVRTVRRGSECSVDIDLLHQEQLVSTITPATFACRDGRSRQEVDAKVQRLVSWNVELLVRILKQIIATRRIVAAINKANNPIDLFAFRREAEPNDTVTDVDVDKFNETLQGRTVINEVVEIIDMPDFDARTDVEHLDFESIEICPMVRSEINSFVTTIAALYRDNPFHNFEHASHVTMSVSKLLSRIVAPERVLDGNNDDSTENSGRVLSSFASSLHDHTYGITSDPMTQFACVFSALIHDVDHPGIPNAQLVKEQDPIATRYKNQSIAEQNSVDIAWRLFMDNDYTNFRNALCPTTYDMQHFRQLVVNSVMATDIVDKELKELRNNRWDVAFQVTISNESVRDQTSRKATIVIEHLIQASDVSHTMQHWHVYIKWNERFYHEMYLAYLQGRSEKDPSEFWYKGEIGFYDFYIIPLAKKLKDCGVFGVSSDEYIQYAMKNRAEWEQRGEEIVARMVEKYKKMYSNQEGFADL